MSSREYRPEELSAQGLTSNPASSLEGEQSPSGENACGLSSKTKTTLALCIGLPVVLGLAGLGWMGATLYQASQELLAPVNNHLALLRANDVRGAYFQSTSMGFKRIETLESFKALVSDNDVLGQNEDFQMQRFHMTSSQAKVDGVLTAKTGEVLPASFVLVKEKDEWRIYGFEIDPDSEDENS
jgi:hypothetical protein